MTNVRYVATVPITYKKDGADVTKFRKVGSMFENTRRETGEVFYSLKLDFPVGVTELVMFPPKDFKDEDGE